jgi:hypothetical protein
VLERMAHSSSARIFSFLRRTFATAAAAAARAAAGQCIAAAIQLLGHQSTGIDVIAMTLLPHILLKLQNQCLATNCQVATKGMKRHVWSWWQQQL